MPTIARVKILTHCNDLGGKVWNPALRWTRKYAVFVEIEDSDGATGLGECWCFDSQPDALIAFLKTEVVPHFLGADPNDLREICADRWQFATLSARHGILASALSGIDIAIWDLHAKRTNQPLWKAIGPDGPGWARLYASGGLYGENKTADDLANEMDGFARQFGIVKMKVGALSLEEDLARVDAVIKKLPPETKLIVDCVYRYNYDQFRRFYDALPSKRIEAIQSPLAAHAYRDMALLVKDGVPVMANEAEYRHELHNELIDRRAVRFLQVAPVACGGLSRLQELTRQIDGTEVELSLEVSSTAVALSAAVQFAAANSRVAHVEHHSIHDVFFDRLALNWQQESGICRPPEGAGLGIEIPRNRFKPRADLAEEQQK